MSWIKMRVALASDPAVIAMASHLNADEDLIVGKLHRIWSWADQQTADGNAPSVTQKWIDRYVNLAGFAEAMQQVGWLAVSDEGISFPNFDRHNGKTAKVRALTANRAAVRRNAGSVTNVTPMPLPEKRREEVLPSPPTASFKRQSATPTYPSIEEVVAYATILGCPKEWAESFWNTFESTGWVNANGNLITNWKARLARWKADQQQGKPQHGTHQRTSGASSGRNSGTANEGRASQYAGMGRAPGFSDPPRPAA